MVQSVLLANPLIGEPRPRELIHDIIFEYRSEGYLTGICYSPRAWSMWGGTTARILPPLYDIDPCIKNIEKQNETRHMMENIMNNLLKTYLKSTYLKHS